MSGRTIRRPRINVRGMLFPNMPGVIQRTAPFRLPPSEIAKIAHLLGYKNGIITNFGHVPAVYDRIARQLQAAARRGQFSDTPTSFWFDQAAWINGGGGGAAEFIRTYTNIAAGGSISSDRMQQVSNNIAQKVLSDILRTGEVPPLHNMVDADIQAALKSDPAQITLAGWGGSFFYWNVPLVGSDGKPRLDDLGGGDPADYLTIGDWIMRRPEERAKFIRTMQETLKTASMWPGLTETRAALLAMKAIKSSRRPKSALRRSTSVRSNAHEYQRRDRQWFSTPRTVGMGVCRRRG